MNTQEFGAISNTFKSTIDAVVKEFIELHAATKAKITEIVQAHNRLSIRLNSVEERVNERIDDLQDRIVELEAALKEQKEIGAPVHQQAQKVSEPEPELTDAAKQVIKDYEEISI